MVSLPESAFALSSADQGLEQGYLFGLQAYSRLNNAPAMWTSIDKLR